MKKYIIYTMNGNTELEDKDNVGEYVSFCNCQIIDFVEKENIEEVIKYVEGERKKEDYYSNYYHVTDIRIIETVGETTYLSYGEDD